MDWLIFASIMFLAFKPDITTQLRRLKKPLLTRLRQFRK